jgi:uncharacterized protein (UPF0333 family)
MNKEDLFILLLALLLLAAMIYTFFFGGQSSRHGVSSLHSANTPSHIVANTKTVGRGQNSKLG